MMMYETAECDCCGKVAVLQTVIAYGIETNACAECRGEVERLIDEDYCANFCHLERREWEDCALVGGCPLAKQRDPQ
jgi:hypothetical protein